MKLIGLMPVRNEAHVLGLSARVALQWCDMLIVADHASDDASRDIMNDLHREFGAERFLIRDDRELQWREMAQRQMLLDEAREEGATHIAIVDADEILSANCVGSIKQSIFAAPDNAIIEVPGYNMRGAIDRYHSNGIWGNRWFSLAFKDIPTLGWATEGYDHHHREPRGYPLLPYKIVRHGQGGVMHLWGASERRLVARHAWYKVTEALKGKLGIPQIEEMYSWAIHGRGPQDNPSKWQFQQAPTEWWAGYEHLMHHLNIEAEPWQEAECRRLVAEHGRERFAGLDLFNVA